MVTDRCASVERKQKELNALIASNEKLQVDIDRSLDLDKVESLISLHVLMQANKRNTGEKKMLEQRKTYRKY